jgi:TonB family protein
MAAFIDRILDSQANYLRSLTYLLCILLSCPAICLARQTSASSISQSASQKDHEKQWQEFASEEGRFSVRMPGTPQKLVAEVDTRAGQLSQPTYVLEIGGAVYLISYVVFPYPVPSDSIQQSKMLDAGRDRMLAKDKTLKLLSEAEISLNGIPGREWMTEDETDVSRGRAFLFNDRLYLVFFSLERKQALRSSRMPPLPANFTELFIKDSEQFFNSLKLTEISSETGGEVDRLLRRLKEQGVEVVTAVDPNDARPLKNSAVIFNGKAVRLVQPQYPSIARAAHASGKVSVEVVIDLEGNIAAAQAVDGHPLLRFAAIKAARESRFTPTHLNGKPAMVVGIIIYDFAAQ